MTAFEELINSLITGAVGGWLIVTLIHHCH